MYENSKLQEDADSETCVHANTQQNFVTKGEIQDRLLLTFHRLMNDRCNYGKFNPMTRPSTERDFISSRTSAFSKRKIGTFSWSHLERISKSVKTKRSNIRGKIYRMDFEHEKSKDSSSDFKQERV